MNHTLPTLLPSRRRGITLTEVMVTTVVMGLLATPLVFSLSSMATAERKTTELADMANTLQPLVTSFEKMVREASADTVAAPANPAFTVSNSNRTLTCFITPNPYDLGTYTQLGTIWFDQATNAVWVQYAWPAAGTAFVTVDGLADCRFYQGPNSVVEGNNANQNYAGRTLGSSRSVLMVVTISVGGRSYEHKVIAYSPNVK